MNQNNQRRRVVISGIGAVSHLGSTIQALWNGCLNGHSGIRRITQFDASEFPCQIAGEVPDFEVENYIERKEARRLPRSTQIAFAAAVQAVADARLPDNLPDPERAAVVFGTAMGGVDRIDEGLQVLRTAGYERVNPFVIPSAIPNLSSFWIARQFRCLGPNSTIVTACATGTQAVGEATELIRRNAADIVITGGTESLIRDFAIAGFSAMRALPVSYNNSPASASRPFDAKREGFIFSEGAGALIVESLEHAQNRGAPIYAEVIGQASSSDGYHVAMPDPTALGASRAILWALQDAGVRPAEVDYINAHGTSTPLNDVHETIAIKQVFGEQAKQLAISSTKSMLGHAMGASGALEAIICALVILNGQIPPTINYEFPDPECDLDYVPNISRKQNVNIALSNSFGLGGQNACLVLRKIKEQGISNADHHE